MLLALGLAWPAILVTCLEIVVGLALGPHPAERLGPVARPWLVHAAELKAFVVFTCILAAPGLLAVRFVRRHAHPGEARIVFGFLWLLGVGAGAIVYALGGLLQMGLGLR